ncbi:THUMP domain-containing protein 3 [Armadillidium nasatum]|uniref:THUMP domain-containing protein 3 n=1 Tax=Armadillidium nasatum TaxID=96803 RepID=A0A5N5T374_9CRUS|nr:THUMP domain-containing protein 3 [Armadillidium nasatum]
MQPSITSLKKEQYKGLLSDNNTVCTLELTVTTGFEEVACQECREKLEVEPSCHLGRIVFDIEIDKVPEALKLRSVENIYVIVLVEENFPFSSEREDCFEKMYKLAGTPDWKKGIKVWQLVFGVEDSDIFEGEEELEGSYCTPKPEIDLKKMKKEKCIIANLPQKNGNTVSTEKSTNTKKIISETQRVGKGPKFRVTCERVGSIHVFGSSEAARQFGGGINEKFGWPVDLKHHTLEVDLNIVENFVYVGLRLTMEPLFKRNVTQFGPTTLKSTICYNMVKLAKPQPGDIVIDPMCGGCSLPIEGALTHTQCFYLGGDIVEVATSRSRMNIDNLVEKEKSLSADTIRWDTTALPLRDQVADVIICDLPFGKRMGSKIDNRVLYFKSLVELARVTRLNTGRAVLLTYDKKSISKSLFRVSSLWKNFSTRNINIGGLIAGVYLLQRTGLFSDSKLTEELKLKGKKRKLSTDE